MALQVWRALQSELLGIALFMPVGRVDFDRLTRVNCDDTDYRVTLDSEGMLYRHLLELCVQNTPYVELRWWTDVLLYILAYFV
jgi:hypothetical protein